MSLGEAKRGVSESFIAENISSATVRRGRLLSIVARTAGAAKTIEAEVDKPLGLTLGQKPGGVVTITVSTIHHVLYLLINLAANLTIC